jgi:hypothetical protein
MRSARWRRERRRGITLVEGTSALVLAGVLALVAGLERDGSGALRELESRGYLVPTAEAPLSVVPFQGGTASHAAGWRPGVVSLRPEPKGDLSPSVYLRHEIMHEANHRTCKGSLPRWADEASAIAFSGGVTQPDESPLSENELGDVRKAIRLRSPLMPKHLRAITRLVARYGWPTAPCAVSPAIENILVSGAAASAGVSYVLISHSSGRVLARSGNQDEAYPLGSVMKVPFVASLRSSPNELESRALIASDTAVLAQSEQRLDRGRYRDLVQGVGGSWRDDLGTTALLGERDASGGFSLQFSLPAAARLVRLALMRAPYDFAVLREHERDESSTLRHAPRRFLELLGGLDAGAKTGSVSDSKGEPLIGHLVIFWPVSKPTLIAVFRKAGVRGAALAELAVPVLERWRQEFDPSEINVRVSLLSQLPQAAWMLRAFDGIEGCREAELAGGDRVTSCGVWSIETRADRARPVRFVAGIVSADGRVLTTDRETYADAVVASEGADLPRAARQALRAVVIWNGLRGGASRGHEHGGLCDTTHCMVFLGHSLAQRDSLMVPPERTDPQSLSYVRSVSACNEAWLPFSLAGMAAWEQRVPAERIARVAREPIVLDLRRELRRTGEVFFRLFYESGEEILPCDKVMTLFDLPSCPETVRHADGEAYVFSGLGEGHGRGLSLETARHMALRGESPIDILKDAYGDERFTKSCSSSPVLDRKLLTR